jgi:hypothetical protein
MTSEIQYNYNCIHFNSAIVYKESKIFFTSLNETVGSDFYGFVSETCIAMLYISECLRGHSQRMSEPGGRGVWKIRTNSDIGGRVFFSNPDVRNLKNFKNKFLFPLF